MAAVNPYLQFDGNCEAAFNFYRSVFKTEFIALSHFNEMPDESGVCDGQADKVMHVSLPIGEGTVLMGSDNPDQGPPFVPGNNFSLALKPSGEAEAKRLFDELSAGGSVFMPLEKTFWGALFGMCKDKFGTSWMVNYDLPKS